jgi:hypothetical protein
MYYFINLKKIFFLKNRFLIFINLHSHFSSICVNCYIYIYTNYFCKINYIEKFSTENNNFYFNNLSYDNLILNKLNSLDINTSSLNHNSN